MTGDMNSIAEKIVSGLAIRDFPDGYLQEDEEAAQFELPPGGEVVMYRELEGVFVMFDYERIFFKDPYEAKYVYYCAKKGLRHIRMPETKALKRILREFQSDIENLRTVINKVLRDMKLDAHEQAEIIRLCSEKVGYSDIMDV